MDPKDRFEKRQGQHDSQTKRRQEHDPHVSAPVREQSPLRGQFGHLFRGLFYDTAGFLRTLRRLRCRRVEIAPGVEQEDPEKPCRDQAVQRQKRVSSASSCPDREEAGGAVFDAADQQNDKRDQTGDIHSDHGTDRTVDRGVAVRP